MDNVGERFVAPAKIEGT